MENWQDTQDRVTEMQVFKNRILDVVENDAVSPDGIKDAIKSAYEMERLLTIVSQQKRSRTNKDNFVVHFSLFDQIQSIIKNVVNAIAHLMKRIDDLKEMLFQEQDKNEELHLRVAQQSATIERYKKANHELQYKINDYVEVAKENEKRKTFMSQFSLSGVPMEIKFREQRYIERDRYV